MAVDPRTPVVVGVGQVTNRRERIVEPMTLMEEAARAAEADSGGRALAEVGSVQVPNIVAWSYPDPGRTLAGRLGIDPAESVYTTVGGNTPQWLLSRACDAIAGGRLDGVLIAGAEAIDSGRQARHQGIELDRGDRDAPPQAKLIGDDRPPTGPAETATGLVFPPVIYAIFETALQAEAGRDEDAQRAWIGRLMQPFTEVAASLPDHAWFPQARTGAEIATVTEDNRLVAEPYTKLMNAILQVDQGAALIVLSAEAADRAGVARDRWIFPLAGADLNDVWLPAQRPSLSSSPALEIAGRAALDAAGCAIDDVSVIDFYSCFPSAVQAAIKAFGLSHDDPRGFTVTGGLPYFGGPGNNYVSHSIAVLVSRLRERGGIGLVTGIGWYLTKHSVGVYGSEPPSGGWKHPDLEAAQERIDAGAVEVTRDASGEAVVEGFTVYHDRRAGILMAPTFARLPDGRRVLAAYAGPPAEVSGRSLAGATVRVRPGEGAPVYEIP